MQPESYTDGPYAISMHQPWASLLVFGVKRIEGRSWPTTFRGRLWIHATATAPQRAVIEEMEESYRQVWALEDAQPTFPKHYPTSALLGCVDVVDCLTAECIEAWPDIPESVRSEVGSRYGYLCDNPRQLVIPQRLSGSQRIWKLPAKLASNTEAGLRPAPQHGKERWTWTAYKLPEGLATSKLPPSANRNKWLRRYGSPLGRTKRNQLSSVGQPGISNLPSSKHAPHDASQSSLDRWLPSKHEPAAAQSPAHRETWRAQNEAAPQDHSRPAAGRAVEAHLDRADHSSSNGVATQSSSGDARKPWGSAARVSMADHLRALHGPDEIFLPQNPAQTLDSHSRGFRPKIVQLGSRGDESSSSFDFGGVAADFPASSKSDISVERNGIREPVKLGCMPLLQQKPCEGSGNPRRVQGSLASWVADRRQ